MQCIDYVTLMCGVEWSADRSLMHIFHMLRLLSKLFTFTWLSTKSANPTQPHIISANLVPYFVFFFWFFSGFFTHTHRISVNCARFTFAVFPHFFLSTHISFNVTLMIQMGLFIPFSYGYHNHFPFHRIVLCL